MLIDFTERIVRRVLTSSHPIRRLLDGGFSGRAAKTSAAQTNPREAKQESEEKAGKRNGKKVGSGSRYKREVQGNYGFRSSLSVEVITAQQSS